MLQTITDFSTNTSPIDFMLVFANWELFAKGLLNTLLLFLSTTIVGALVALPLGIVRAHRVPLLSPLILSFTYFFRGTPLLVQTYLLYYGASEFESVRQSFLWPIFKEAWGCAFVAFTINTAAYVTEIVCAGIRSVPSGEIEAAKACGMRTITRLKRIVVPGAFRIMLPTYSNEVIFALQATVVASTITIVDVLGAGRTLNGMFYLAYEGFLAAAAIYVVLTFCIVGLFVFLESRLNRHLQPMVATA